ncbi:anhydro-N-acetylmuramic acid kinase [Flagellimonas sp. DF-77]|uniref:anhydro-N-acetylmuramic acid kinase n=1 Tax=Flagellimonas algarum TaxID=3230298 RepID=UPI0033912272
MSTYRVLGMMSGTSLDGLDLAYCHFEHGDQGWSFEILEATTIPYGTRMLADLQNAIHHSESRHDELHQEYGHWLGEQAKAFLTEHGLSVDFLASHGHTSHHRPEAGITFQLGAGQALADASGHRVICDFRTLDVQLNGQGAPLVPIGDSLLFADFDFCLNLGGISNISFQKHEKRIAFDIGMANMPLNHITATIGQAYDAGGTMARSGTVDTELMEALNALEYYRLSYPKSTGFEWFEAEIKPLIEKCAAPIQDQLHTIIKHNCVQIAKVVAQEASSGSNRLLVTGGGALNTFFVDCLREALHPFCEVIVPSKRLIEYKEAMVFGFMGVLKERNAINILASVTGAERDSSSGVLFKPSPHQP